MAESSSSVRLLQQHLRQAGTALAARQFDAAAAQIDAALAIDPASLAALTLRGRLTALRSSDPEQLAPTNAITPPPMAPPATARFVPAGVDAASWTDFEQRVQERRFAALVTAADRAIASGDRDAARVSIEEARELRPEALDVTRLSMRLAMLPVSFATETARRESVLWSRTFRAASLLLLGVTLLMGLDWVRSGPQPGGEISDASIGTAGLATAVSGPVPVATPAVDTAPTTEAERTPIENLTAAPLSTPVPIVAPTPLPESELLVASEVLNNFVALPSARAVRSEVFEAPVISGETPDDYVAPRREQQREPAPVAAARPAPPPTPLANVARQPLPLTGPLVGSASPAGGQSPAPAPPLASTPPANTPASTVTAAVVVAPTAAELTRVQTVLYQYARAYGQLNAGAVREVWPSVDERALAKAFSNLSSQSVSFDSCSIDINGASAQASCHGKASYVGKIGSQEPRTESRTVRFELKRDGESWRIQKAETRR